MQISKWAIITFYAKRLLIVDALIALIVAVVCWLINWHTLAQYGVALILSGVVLLLTSISAIGSTQYLSDPAYMMARSVEAKPLHQRMREDLAHIRDSFDWTLMTVVVSLSLVGFGLLIGFLAA